MWAQAGFSSITLPCNTTAGAAARLMGPIVSYLWLLLSDRLPTYEFEDTEFSVCMLGRWLAAHAV